MLNAQNLVVPIPHSFNRPTQVLSGLYGSFYEGYGHQMGGFWPEPIWVGEMPFKADGDQRRTALDSPSLEKYSKNAENSIFGRKLGSGDGGQVWARKKQRVQELVVGMKAGEEDEDPENAILSEKSRKNIINILRRRKGKDSSPRVSRRIKKRRGGRSRAEKTSKKSLIFELKNLGKRSLLTRRAAFGNMEKLRGLIFGPEGMVSKLSDE